MRHALLAAACSLLVAAGAIVLGACQDSASAARPKGGGADVDLAPLMSEFQRHSMKLGFAIAAHNQRLSRFYVKELRETLAEVEKVKEAEWVPIGATAKVILPEPLDNLDDSLAAGEWSRVDGDYKAVIAGCNRCHAATGHEYIKIVPAHGAPPWNQEFTP
jgi:hypothetical protein